MLKKSEHVKIKIVIIKAKTNVKLNIIVEIFLIFLYFSSTNNLENSGTSKLLKLVTSKTGNIIMGIAIPFTIPYDIKLFDAFIPLYCKLEGIINCLIVDRPERKYDVKATGIVILKIRLL